MTDGRAFGLLLTLWGLCVIVGLWRFAVLAPTDFGFTRGMNRLEALLSWWAAAAMLALPVWLAGRRSVSRAQRWAARLPLLWLAAIVALVAALLVWAQVQPWRDPPDADPLQRPATVPTDPDVRPDG
jgi:phosphatidylserine synthase